ncbi:MAG: NAD(P)-binding domain-containing protein [Roseinatronobacter sp.]
MAQLALIGAGAMGGAIGLRLLQTGTKLRVFDLDLAKVAVLVAEGAEAAASTAEAAKGAEATILSLNSPRSSSAVFGPGGVAEGAETGAPVIDMSSIDPVAMRAFAERAAATGLGWVDSPLSGGIPKVAAGALTLMQGGYAAQAPAPKPCLPKSPQTRPIWGLRARGRPPS